MIWHRQLFSDLNGPAGCLEACKMQVPGAHFQIIWFSKSGGEFLGSAFQTRILGGTGMRDPWTTSYETLARGSLDSWVLTLGKSLDLPNLCFFVSK